MLSMARPDRAFATQRSLPLAWWLVTAAVTAVGGAAALRKVVHHDVGYWIDAAGRLLDGAVLYRDLIELNPPTNYLVNIVPVALARAAGLDPIVTFHAFVLGLALLAAAMSACVLRRLFDDGVTAQAMMLPLAIVFLALPHNDFGQREHILGMLLLPYLLLAASRPSDAMPGALRLAAGAMAGMVVAYKPYFILYPAVAEGLRLLHERRVSAAIRIETIAAAAMIGAAALTTLLAFPEYVDFIVPLGRAIYHGFEAPLLQVLLRPEFLIAGLVIAADIMLLRRTAEAPARRCAAVLTGCAVAGMVIYVVQMKGWRYHVLPALILAWTALGLLLVARAAALLREGAGSRLALGGGLALAGLFAASHLYAASARDSEIRAAMAPLVKLVRREADGGPALFLSTHLTYAFPVVNYAGIAWPYRYHHLLPLPGLYTGYRPGPERAFRAPAEMSATEAAFFAAVVEDALRFPPRVILVDRRQQMPPIDALGFDLLAYFKQDPRFAALLRNYRPAGRIAGQDIYLRRE